MEMMFAPLKRYADFNGRSRRSEYWFFQLFFVILYVVFLALLAITGGFSGNGNMLSGLVGLIFGIGFLGLFVPALAVLVRRLHDTDKSGWWALISFVPFGGLVLLVFCVMEGTKGPNKFGADPKGSDAEIFA